MKRNGTVSTKRMLKVLIAVFHLMGISLQGWEGNRVKGINFRKNNQKCLFFRNQPKKLGNAKHSSCSKASNSYRVSSSSCKVR